MNLMLEKYKAMGGEQAEIAVYMYQSARVNLIVMYCKNVVINSKE